MEKMSRVLRSDFARIDERKGWASFKGKLTHSEYSNHDYYSHHHYRHHHARKSTYVKQTGISVLMNKKYLFLKLSNQANVPFVLGEFEHVRVVYKEFLVGFTHRQRFFAQLE